MLSTMSSNQVVGLSTTAIRKLLSNMTFRRLLSMIQCAAQRYQTTIYLSTHGGKAEDATVTIEGMVESPASTYYLPRPTEGEALR